jgi:DNA primase
MARVADVVLEKLKRDISVRRLAEVKGVVFKKSGDDNLLGHCPFHEDRTPSFVVSEKKNLWHCLGACRAGGSVIDFVMKAEGVTFRHAVELLREGVDLSGAVGPRVATVPKLSSPVEDGVDDATALGQVVGYYHRTLKDSPEALDYLASRGLADDAAIAHFRLGFSNRTLGLRLPHANREAGARLRGQLQQLGVLRDTGHEAMRGRLVVPLVDEAGVARGLYGRAIGPLKNASNHLYLPGPHQVAFNSAALAGQSTAILCEAVFDALAFWVAGHRNVTAAYGTEGFTAHHVEALKRHGVRDVLIAFDRDDAGDVGAAAVARQLEHHGFDCYRVLFPRGMDANEYALKVQPASKSLAVALRQAAFMGTGLPRRVADFSSLAASRSGPVAGGEAGLAAEASNRALGEKRVARATAAKTVTVSASADSVHGALDTDARPPATSQASTTALAMENLGRGDPQKSGPAINESAPPSPPPMMATEAQRPVAPRAPEVVAEVTEEEALFHFGQRRYRVRGLARALSAEALKVNVLVSQGEAFHVDTVDMYSARQRAAFLRAAAEELRVPEETLKRDVGALLLKLESLQESALKAKLAPKKTAPTLADDERAAALELLQHPRLLDVIVDDFERCGVVGEETNKLVGYLAAVSRKLEEPLAVLIQSSSAAGKSSLMEAVLAFVPDEEKTKFSAMTGQALFYMGDADVKHKVLAVVEEEGASRAAYALKLLQSEGELTIASTGKDPASGKLVTHEYRVEGPTQLFLTTTASELDDELLNRCLVLTVDEERAQTRAIHDKQREKQTLEGLLAKRDKEAVLKLHQNAQRLLRPLAVVNPYARQLTFLDDRTRARRDFPKYLTLIRTIALLQQYQRPVKTVQHRGQAVEYVEVTLADIATANRLAASVLGRSLDDLPPQTRKLLTALDAWVARGCTLQGVTRAEYRFTRRQVREALHLGDTQLKLHLGRLAELEYLRVLRGREGGFEYVLLYEAAAEGGRFLPGLVDVALLAAPSKAHDYDGGRSGSDTGRSGSEASRSAPGRPSVGAQSAPGRGAVSDEKLKGLHPLAAQVGAPGGNALLAAASGADAVVPYA